MYSWRGITAPGHISQTFLPEQVIFCSRGVPPNKVLGVPRRQTNSKNEFGTN